MLSENVGFCRNIDDFEKMPINQGFSRFLTLFSAIMEIQVKCKKTSKINGLRTLKVKNYIS